MIKHVDLLFHKPADEAPPRSGTYIAYTEYGGITSLLYSKKHHAWNCLDSEEDPTFKISYDDTYVVAWADTSLANAKLNSWRK